MIFDSIYSIALDILDKAGGDPTEKFDSSYSISLAILDALGGDATQKYDSIYSVMLAIYAARFGEDLPDQDSIYSIALAMDRAISDAGLDYDSTYSILLGLDTNPSSFSHKFTILTSEDNTVTINGENVREVMLPKDTVVTWSVSRTGYVTQSGTYTMTNEDHTINVSLLPASYDFSIVATPNDATIVINDAERSTVSATYGSTVSWSVTREGYISQSGTYVMGAGNHTENVTLTVDQFDFTVSATPNDSTITINGSETNTVTVDYGSTVTWSVSKTGYVTQSGTYVMGASDHTETVTLVLAQFTVTISPTPDDATVVINGSERSSFTADYGTTITWSVSKEHYVTQTGTFTLEDDTTLTPSLNLVQHTFSITATPNDASILINGSSRSTITANYGTFIYWYVMKDHYVTQSGSFYLYEDCTETVTLVLEQFTFEINPTPADATVIINGVERSTLTADYGTSITWSVSKTGYGSRNGSYTLTDDHTENINLTINQYTFSINPTPVDATVTINGVERSTLTADYGTSITWSVAKSHYITQSGSLTLDDDISMNVNLNLDQHTFTISATPNDATVVINGEERTSFTAVHGTAITWSVSKTHYVTQTGSYTLDGDHTENVTLALEQHTFTINPTPNDATVIINSVERSTLTADYGTSITWSVSASHYETSTGSLTLTEDTTQNVSLTRDSHTFTIDATPNDATVIINGVERSTFTTTHGSTITWSVSKTNYVSQSGTYTLESDHTETVTLALEQHTFTISPTPSDATVIINGVERSSITADYGTEITWSVSKTGYGTRTGSYTLTADHTESVNLTIDQYTVTITPTPSDATVTINNVAQSTLTANYGTLISWEVSRTGYVTQSGSFTLTADVTLTPSLVIEQYDFTIVPTPNDATVTINGSTTTSVTVDYGSTVTWSVAKSGYITQSGTYTMGAADHTESVSLSPDSYTFTIVATPNDATVIINGAERSTITASAGSTITWEVSKTGYTTESGTYVLNSDHTETVTLVVFIDYLTFVPQSTGTIYWKDDDTAHKTLRYSTDNGSTWTDVVSTAAGTAIPVTQNQEIKFTYTSTQAAFYPAYFDFNGIDIQVYGDVTTMCDPDVYTTLGHAPDNTFWGLFKNCSTLYNHPTKNISLPYAILGVSSYREMFYGCSHLTRAPQLSSVALADRCYQSMFEGCSALASFQASLPATTLTLYCYYMMFRSCSSLTAAPTLPALTMANSSYSYMFDQCTSLAAAPSLPATTLANSCYNNMFNGCSSITTAPTLSATSLATQCYSAMFRNCTSLTTAPSLPATTLAEGCYLYMFYGCTALTTAPKLPATSLVTSCYNYMFYNCSSLNYIEALFTTTISSSTSFTTNWVSGVAATGTFVKSKNAAWYLTGVNGVPSGWMQYMDVDFIIETTPSDATVEVRDITGPDTWQSYTQGDIWTARIGFTPAGYSWTFVDCIRVSKPGYVTRLYSVYYNTQADYTPQAPNIYECYIYEAVTFAINPTPADATVMIDGVPESSTVVEAGYTVTWSVFKTGYLTQSGTYTMSNANVTMPVVLQEEKPYYFSNYSFTTEAPGGWNKAAVFEFTYDSQCIEPVTFTLTNLVPDSSDTRFVAGVGTGEYVFTPDDQNNAQSVTLYTVDWDDYSVTIESTNYNPVTVSGTAKNFVSIESNSLQLKENGSKLSNGDTFYLNDSTGTQLTSGRVKSSGYNNTFSINKSKINEDIYFSCLSTSWGTTTYYYTPTGFTVRTLDDAKATSAERLIVDMTATVPPWQS